MIYLDVTRILNRVSAAAPTGIDRVELEYAAYGAKNGFRYVAQAGDSLCLVPTWIMERLVEFYMGRWNGSGLNTANPLYIDEHKAVLLVERWRKSLNTRGLPSNSAASFLRRLSSLNYRERISLLSGHLNIEPRRRFFIPKSLIRFFFLIAPSFFEKVAHWLKRDARPKPTGGIAFEPASNGLVYVNVGHAGLDKIGLMKAIRAAHNVTSVFYIHDILPITHPHLFPEGTKSDHQKRISNVVDSADAILTNSYFTKSELEREFDLTTSPTVLEIGTLEPADIKSVATKQASERAGFASIGTIEPRKNYLWLVKAWLRFCETMPSLAKGETLTIFGKQGWLDDAQYRELETLVSSSDRVCIKHGASDQEVRDHLVNARAYVTAAEVEGWGMPLAESLSLGTPVIASDADAHHEVTRGIASFFSANDESALQYIFREHYELSYLENRISMTKSFEPWRWEPHFKRFTDWVEGRP